ncbi:MAG: ABC transporter permease [Cetobacterium somerae]|uniref:Putative spermidine/putrescine ABC transporter, permease protein PotB n=1 Tax=Cetobacterium somerae ATCC BAA-474 TaxID=1319815 RepID=U7VGT4_9FUSO|nr:MULTISPECIES: ABC transporter permease [Cetobacterium]ERT70038.1 putative spermidine/putrescine ABC transporter, permease protein PotB [Cetobacterium somerae ATCC BAA-474]MBC2853761.1 ABC transporter permease [Cetobacterium sp. 2G large]MCQ9626667.1 ABC transporter permease [Cetobacterium somerae]WVJ02084.1 ABC transporter permease [Cetobacterium somerae]
MKKISSGSFYSIPLTLWMSVFFVIPMLIVLSYAFLTKGTYGGVQMIFTLKNFNVFFEPIFLKILFRTIYISIAVTFITVLLAVPTAYFIARSKFRQELLILVIIPFWTNFLIRIYAWISILGSNGFLNTFLIKLGIIETPLKLLYNTGSVILITVYTSLPFAILPLYAIIEKFDFSLVEAARDLGATNSQAFRKVFLPNIKSGIITAILFTFIPAMGSYAIPKLVGGTQATMLGNIIAQHLTVTRNWPLASAISAMLILVTSIALLIFMRAEKKSKEVSDE